MQNAKMWWICSSGGSGSDNDAIGPMTHTQTAISVLRFMVVLVVDAAFRTLYI